MTTAITIETPTSHCVRVVHEDRYPDGWRFSFDQMLEPGSVRTVYVWDARRVSIEESPVANLQHQEQVDR